MYMTLCASCHQENGSGIPGLCPPLASSPRLTGPPEDLIRILLLGMKGKVVRDGAVYNGVMPSWKFDLTDSGLAAVINELYAKWNPGAPRVTEELVRKIRAECTNKDLFPTEKDLNLPH